MRGERTLLSTAIRRCAAALLTAATALVLAPPAMADPMSDATDAINQAYDASGGATGPMGPSDGGVYPVGVGFGQNYAGGKILFTPDTGAHVMGGAILQKYDSLGGAGDGDLGFPTIDEGAGKAPGSRNTTFSAADKPVIFWTPDTGAHVVRGAINAAWDKLGGSAGPLGVPAEDEVYKDDVVSQKFTGGEVSWNRKSKEFATTPPELAAQLAGLTVPEDPASAINAARRAAGGPLGPLGAKQGEQYAIGQDGAGQAFAGGKIFYSPATGANVVTGQVLKKYESVGGPQSDLGFPISDEADGGLKTGSRVSAFAAEDKPVIFWTPDYGAFVVRGAMNAAWQKLGGAAGSLGPPVADQSEQGNTVKQRFTGGEISWDKQTNKFSTEPANLASGLSGLTVPGYHPPEASNAAAPQSNERHWFTPSWWWLFAAIPVLVLVGLVLAATLRHRGDGDDETLDDDDHFDFDAVHDPEASHDSEASPVDGTEANLAESYGASADSARHGLGGYGRVRYALPGGEVDEGHDIHEISALSDQEPEPDESDTGPIEVVEPDADSGRHSAIELDEPEEDLDEPEEAPSSAPTPIEPTEEPEPKTAIHLPLDDPYNAPTGYPIKADTKTGLFWAPESDLYDHVPAELYFLSEEFARANGFEKAD